MAAKTSDDNKFRNWSGKANM